MEHREHTPHGTKLIIRYMVFALGLCINSFGIVLITKGMLGTSQISSLPYVVSLKYPHISFGVASLVMNILFLVVQIVVSRWRINFSHLLQLPVSLAFGAVIDAAMSITQFIHLVSLPARVFTTLLGCVILGLGISIEVAPKVVTVPGEGIVYSLAQASGIKFGTVKIIFDIVMVISGLILSLIFFGEIRGIGMGTVMSAIIVGKVVSFFDTRFKHIYRCMHTCS